MSNFLCTVLLSHTTAFDEMELVATQEYIAFIESLSADLPISADRKIGESVTEHVVRVATKRFTNYLKFCCVKRVFIYILFALNRAHCHLIRVWRTVRSPFAVTLPLST